MNIDLMKEIERELKKVIKKSEIPEDFPHAENVKEWVLRLKSDADIALQIAALAHDIERAISHRKILRNNFKDYNSFKKAHSINSAKITLEILNKFPLSKEVKDRVRYLIENHELGLENDQELSVLRDADGLSFFEVNLPLYFQRHNIDDTVFRMQWGYKRLSERAKIFLKQFKYKNETLNNLLKKCIDNKKY